MELSQARYLADTVIAKLKPVTDRIMVAGSVRRQKRECHDIDIVLIPKRRHIKDLFGMVTSHVPIEDFCNRIDSWEKSIGEATGKYTQRIIDGMKVEISMCNFDNFGNISLIRTGDKDFSKIIMTRVLKCGFEQHDGYLWNGSKKMPLLEEEQYFKILDLPFVPPHLRDKDAFKRVKV